MLFFAKPKGPVHTRRWSAQNIVSLRHASSKLPEDRRPAVLKATAGDVYNEFANFAREAGFQDGDPPFNRNLALPLLERAQAFFDIILLSTDTPKDGFVLPPSIVYQNANLLRQPPPAPPEAALMPVAKACKLEGTARPRDARDPRRQNRLLHLCQACGAYKQAVEFYVCCLHDEMRCCRDCMLVRIALAAAAPRCVPPCAACDHTPNIPTPRR